MHSQLMLCCPNGGTFHGYWSILFSSWRRGIRFSNSPSHVHLFCQSIESSVMLLQRHLIYLRISFSVHLDFLLRTLGRLLTVSIGKQALSLHFLIVMEHQLCHLLPKLCYSISASRRTLVHLHLLWKFCQCHLFLALKISCAPKKNMGFNLFTWCQ